LVVSGLLLLVAASCWSAARIAAQAVPAPPPVPEDPYWKREAAYWFHLAAVIGSWMFGMAKAVLLILRSAAMTFAGLWH
jgi:hypothetical protein